MIDVFKLIGSIILNNDDANEKIDETTEKAKSASEGLGKAVSAIAKGVTIAVGACATGVTAITKQAVDAYADYEQLVGGVETLFKESADIIKGYADEAYISAGLSANNYMETVTGFSASLLQSLDGDTKKSAEYANRAVVDMADNANKMGTAIESIQNAYQGFAKQNYTMLDNLKLGYGGTKEEMARLIEDASKLKDVQKELGVTVDANSMSFGNIVNAITVMQTSMGIAGTTSMEANTTISGSLSMLKSAWENTLVAMGNDGADFEAVIKKLVDSAVIVSGNLLPRIQVIFDAIPNLVNQLAPQIPGIVQTLLPSLLKSSANLLNGLVKQIPSLIKILASTIHDQSPMLFGEIGNMLEGMANSIQENLPIFTEKAKELVGGLGEKIQENLPGLISKGLDILLGLSRSILENIPILVSVGMDLIKSLVNGVIDALPELIAKAPEIITNFANTITQSMEIIIFSGAELIWNLIAGIIQSIPDLINNIGQIIEAIIAVWNAVNWLNLGKNMINSIKNGIENMGGTLKSKVTSLFNAIKNAIIHPIETAKTILHGILDSIKAKFSSVFEGAKNIVKKAIETIKGYFKFTWSLPTLKLPHFKISGAFSLSPPSAPKFSVDWYKKAMDNAMVLRSPTIFGYNGDQFLGGGEAGNEVVAGEGHLMNLIQNAVLSQNTGIIDVLYKILDAILTMDENLGGNLREALEGTALSVNKREFARLVKAVEYA